MRLMYILGENIKTNTLHNNITSVPKLIFKCKHINQKSITDKPIDG